MEVTKNYDGKNLTIEVGDHIDTGTASDFENEIMGGMGKFDSLALDFAKIDYISSAGFKSIGFSSEKLKSKDYHLKLIIVMVTIKEILSMFNFDKILTIK